MKITRRFRQWKWKVLHKITVFLVERLYGEDMLWDHDDPETPIYSMDEWAEDRWGPSNVGDVTTVTFQRALALPKRAYRVTSILNEASDEMIYRFDRLP